MMKAVLKTLALSFGGGLALGAGLRLTQGAAKKREEPALDLDPLLARLKKVESRIVQIETAPRAAPVAPAPAVIPEKTLAAFESRLAAQFADVEHLRVEMRRVDQRLGEMDAQIPVLIQSTVSVQFREVEHKLQLEFEEAQSRSMTAFVDTLQTKVVERITALETNLAEQSTAIGNLRDSSLRTDENLQKMLAGIEKLVDQTRAPQAPPPSPRSTPPHEAEPKPQPMTAGIEAEKAREPIVHKPATARTFEPSIEPEPTPISEAYLAAIPQDIPILAGRPEITHPGAAETAHSNGVASEKVSEPAPVLVKTAEPVAEPVKGPEPAPAAESAPPAEPPKSEESYEWVNRIGLELLAPRPKPRIGWRLPLAVGLAAGLILVAGLLYSGVLQKYFNPAVAQPSPTLATTAPAPEPAPPATNANDVQSLEQRASAKPSDPAALIDLAREYQRRKEWAKAEAAYRSALEASPGNRDAALGLSDVLYQEQKYEESAAVLNKLSSGKSQ
ncbi:MAG TPA: tetratricopeptide repeat protein [Candidatus Nitrosotalea sp.]|nr:tetratricopeptide repeat protein [Candidatus Nitrosotalea sp.]